MTIHKVFYRITSRKNSGSTAVVYREAHSDEIIGKALDILRATEKTTFFTYTSTFPDPTSTMYVQVEARAEAELPKPKPAGRPPKVGARIIRFIKDNPGKYMCEEVAKELGVSPGYVHKVVTQHRLPVKRVRALPAAKGMGAPVPTKRQANTGGRGYNVERLSDITPSSRVVDVVRALGSTKDPRINAVAKSVGCSRAYTLMIASALVAYHQETRGASDTPAAAPQVFSHALTPEEKGHSVMCAARILHAAAGHLEDRADTYDAPGGERSMPKTVDLFNSLYGTSITYEQGWMFMAMLKMVRSSQGVYRADSYEDGAAYMALAGEAASNTTQEQ